MICAQNHFQSDRYSLTNESYILSTIKVFSMIFEYKFINQLFI